jgi:GH35 family endo-1,4-beta-xylanase
MPSTETSFLNSSTVSLPIASWSGTPSNKPKGHDDWHKLDRLVKFAEASNMAVKGHWLISICYTPDAKLFPNQNLVEVLFKKRQEFYHLVTRLVTKGLAIDGIALQMHTTLLPLLPGVIAEMFDSYKALGMDNPLSSQR